MMKVLRTSTFVEWFDRLRDPEAKQRISIRIDRLRAGNPGDIKFLGGGVSEMRVAYGPGYRLYCVRHGDTVVVLLCGGDKSDQRRDIDTARRLLKEVRDEGWLN